MFPLGCWQRAASVPRISSSSTHAWTSVCQSAVSATYLLWDKPYPTPVPHKVHPHLPGQNPTHVQTLFCLTSMRVDPSEAMGPAKIERRNCLLSPHEELDSQYPTSLLPQGPDTLRIPSWEKTEVLA